MSQPSDAAATPEPIPQGPLAGAQFAAVAWAVLRSRWRLMLPAVLVAAVAVALADIALSTWVFGSVAKAAAHLFDPATVVADWAANPRRPLPDQWPRAAAALFASALVLPTIPTLAVASVVADAESGRRGTPVGYLRRSVMFTPVCLAASLMASTVAVVPAATVLVLVAVMGASAVVASLLLVLGGPALLWLLVITVRMSLAPQVIAGDGGGPLSALRASWRVTRGSLLRVLAISLAASLTGAIAGALVAAPITAAGTAAGAGQTTPSTGKALSEHFLATTTTSAVSTTIGALVTALLLIDLRRRAAGPLTQPPAPDTD